MKDKTRFVFSLLDALCLCGPNLGQESIVLSMDRFGCCGNQLHWGSQALKNGKIMAPVLKIPRFIEWFKSFLFYKFILFLFCFF